MDSIVGHESVVNEHAFPDDPGESQAVVRARRRVERAERKYRAAAAKVIQLRDSGAAAWRVLAARREMWALHEPLEAARSQLANAERRSRKRTRRRR